MKLTSKNRLFTVFLDAQQAYVAAKAVYHDARLKLLEAAGYEVCPKGHPRRIKHDARIQEDIDRRYRTRVAHRKKLERLVVYNPYTERPERPPEAWQHFKNNLPDKLDAHKIGSVS